MTSRQLKFLRKSDSPPPKSKSSRTAATGRSGREDEKDPEGWKHPAELIYSTGRYWTDKKLFYYCIANALSVSAPYGSSEEASGSSPSSSLPPSPFPDLLCVSDGKKTVVMSEKYRLPIMFASFWEWTKMRKLLTPLSDSSSSSTSSARDPLWSSEKFEVLHIARVWKILTDEGPSASLLSSSNANSTPNREQRIAGIKKWRCHTLDRVLTRFRMGCFTSESGQVAEFWEKWREEEYGKDILEFDWRSWLAEPRDGIFISPNNFQSEIDPARLMEGLVEKNGTWYWDLTTTSNSALPPLQCSSAPVPPDATPAWNFRATAGSFFGRVQKGSSQDSSSVSTKNSTPSKLKSTPTPSVSPSAHVSATSPSSPSTLSYLAARFGSVSSIVPSSSTSKPTVPVQSSSIPATSTPPSPTTKAVNKEKEDGKMEGKEIVNTIVVPALETKWVASTSAGEGGKQVTEAQAEMPPKGTQTMQTPPRVRRAQSSASGRTSPSPHPPASTNVPVKPSPLAQPSVSVHSLPKKPSSPVNNSTATPSSPSSVTRPIFGPPRPPSKRANAADSPPNPNPDVKPGGTTTMTVEIMKVRKDNEPEKGKDKDKDKDKGKESPVLPPQMARTKPKLPDFTRHSASSSSTSSVSSHAGQPVSTALQGPEPNANANIPAPTPTPTPTSSLKQSPLPPLSSVMQEVPTASVSSSKKKLSLNGHERTKADVQHVTRTGNEKMNVDTEVPSKQERSEVGISMPRRTPSNAGLQLQSLNGPSLTFSMPGSMRRSRDGKNESSSVAQMNENSKVGIRKPSINADLPEVPQKSFTTNSSVHSSSASVNGSGKPTLQVSTSTPVSSKSSFSGTSSSFGSAMSADKAPTTPTSPNSPIYATSLSDPSHAVPQALTSSAMYTRVKRLGSPLEKPGSPKTRHMSYLPGPAEIEEIPGLGNYPMVDLPPITPFSAGGTKLFSTKSPTRSPTKSSSTADANTSMIRKDDTSVSVPSVPLEHLLALGSSSNASVNVNHDWMDIEMEHGIGVGHAKEGNGSTGNGIHPHPVHPLAHLLQ